MKVEVVVNGKRHGPPMHVAPGDSILYTAEGEMLEGRHTIAEENLKRCRREGDSLRNRNARLVARLEDIAGASSLADAHRIAREIVGEPYGERIP